MRDPVDWGSSRNARKASRFLRNCLFSNTGCVLSLPIPVRSQTIIEEMDVSFQERNETVFDILLQDVRNENIVEEVVGAPLAIRDKTNNAPQTRTTQPNKWDLRLFNLSTRVSC